MLFQDRFLDKFLNFCSGIVCHDISQLPLVLGHILPGKLQTGHLHKQCNPVFFISQLYSIPFLES